MNLTEEIRARLETFSMYAEVYDIKAALEHIEAAEKHFVRARHTGDDDAFRDVIYRSNQAFEGMIREAFGVLEPTTSRKISVHDIEQRFLAGRRLSPRVLAAFQRYRQEWRNVSTHDHTAMFSEDEALLAIVSVSAFAVVLLDQLIRTASFRRYEDSLAQRELTTRILQNYSQLAFDDQIIALLVGFSGGMCAEMGNKRKRRKRPEVVGRLAAYLSTTDATLKVDTAVQVGQLEADLVIRRGATVAPLMVKSVGKGYFLDWAANRVTKMLPPLGTRLGFVFMPPLHDNDVMRAAQVRYHDKRVDVAVVAPEPYVMAPPEERRTG